MNKYLKTTDFTMCSSGTDDFTMVDSAELIPESLQTNGETDTISFCEAINQVFSSFPSFQEMLQARNRAAEAGASDSVILVDCAIMTQLWLRCKTANTNEQATKELEEKMISLWQQFIED